MEQNVLQSIPRRRIIRSWVNFMVVSLSSSQASVSVLNRWRARVPRPDLVRVRITLYSWPPRLKAKVIAPLLVPSRTQPPTSSLRVCSKRQSAMASMNREDFPTPF